MGTAQVRFLFLALVVGLASLIGALILVGNTSAQAPPPVPHPLEGKSACLACHEAGVGGAPQFPANHAGRTNETCQGCHLAAPTTPSALTPIPTPIAAPSVPKEQDTCFRCHKALGGRHETITDEWEESIHAAKEVGCASCHGGDPLANEMTVAMSAEKGFIGVPERGTIPELCGSCHADVSLMRQYALPTDQLAKYRESQHGKLLAEGDPNVATCYDCHGGHAIKDPYNPGSTTYPINVPQTCASCHSDEALMRPYGIPTNQYDLYKESVHGIALLERQDRRAPSCADCHGTHGAAPPGFAEVQNVCGKCHSATEDYFTKSVHSKRAEGPECVTCHGRYDVSIPTEAMFLGSEPRHCGSCHDPESGAGVMVTAIYDAITEATRDVQQAEDAVARAEANRMIVVQEKEGLIEARASLIEARAIQHTVDISAVKEKTEAAIAMSETVRQAAEEATSEAAFRRKAMVVAVFFIGLTTVALWLVKREIDRSRPR